MRVLPSGVKARLRHACSWVAPLICCTPAATSNVLTCPGFWLPALMVPTARVLLSRLKASELMPPGKPANSFCIWPVFGSHNFTVASQLPVAIIDPSGEMATLSTALLWPRRVSRGLLTVIGLPSAGRAGTSQTQAIISRLPLTSVLPSCDKATLSTQLMWFSSVAYGAISNDLTGAAATGGAAASLAGVG